MINIIDEWQKHNTWHAKHWNSWESSTNDEWNTLKHNFSYPTELTGDKGYAFVNEWNTLKQLWCKM